MPNLNVYDVHGIVSVASQVALPELERFRTDAPIAAPTITVQVGKVRPRPAQAPAPINEIYYDEGWGPLGFKARIEIGETIQIEASAILEHSPHVLYTNLVEPILRWTFVKKGYALVHGATIAYGNEAYMVTARTDTGKTTTVLKILNRQRRGSDKIYFLADDLTLVRPDGCVLTYPKPFTISNHTLHAINMKSLVWKERLGLRIQSLVHSRSGRRAAHQLARTRLPMATINTWVQLLIPPPKYDVHQLVPNAKLAQQAQLAGLFVIERGGDGEVVLSSAETLETILANSEDAYGFPPYHAIKDSLYGSNGTDLRALESEIIAGAFQNVPARILRSKDMNWWKRIPHLIGSGMAEDFVERSSGRLTVRPEPVHA